MNVAELNAIFLISVAILSYFKKLISVKCLKRECTGIKLNYLNSFFLLVLIKLRVKG